MSDQGYKFDWHSLGDYDAEGFLRWMVVNLLSEHTDNGDVRPELDHLINRVGEASADYREVVLTIQLNGVDVNVEHFVRNVHANMHDHARRAAVNWLREHVDVGRLLDDATAIGEALTSRAREIAHQVGLDVYWNEEDD
jgi:hypothetical protein